MEEMVLHDGPLGGMELVGPRPPHRVVVLETGPGARVLYRVRGRNEAGVWVAKFDRMLPSQPTRA